ncbi:MAG: DEAD/DEAH box helicase, partial [Planctomycetota bacterium]
MFLVDPERMEGEPPPAGDRPGATLSSSPRGGTVLRVLQVEPVGADAGSLQARIREVGAAADRTFFVCRNEAEEARARHLLEALPAPGPSFLRGRLSRSFQLPDAGLAVLGYDDLLQHMSRRRPAVPRPAPARPIEDFLDLEAGDLVVHLDLGGGRFGGVERIRKHGVPIEHCVVEFRDGVRVYVPVSRIDLIQKYVGASGHRPRLGRVGGAQWGRTKDRVRRAVQDLAVRLLDLQALRRKKSGIAHPADDALQHEFEASFAYEETPDQISAMRGLKADLELARPMDRLLCGDVGYGKTELAMRAAFKVVCGGRQVVVLVPTTVLAAQHHATFRERLAGYAVRVEMLSRLRTDREAKTILEEVERGAVDILIGTHRLLGGRVRFRDLGLVVIDEEQRFGVEHKERLKSLRAVVDVLTMTATPIPRTLNM